MRTAFYAGAWALFSVNDQIGDPDVTEEQGVEMLHQIYLELMAFQTQLIFETAAKANGG